MKKILLFQMNGIAYDSTRFFSSCLGKALENAGIEVTWFDFQRQTMKDLEALCGQSFDAVIDYNSKLPGAVLDDGTPFLNHIQAPFYNYILDHPVYHHANLSVLLENYHVICIDDDHNKYISKWYPHIKSVHTLSVGAAKAENAVKSEQHRKEGILFPATYLNPRDYYELITALPDSMQKYTKAVLDCLLSDTHCTFEAAAMQVYKEWHFRCLRRAIFWQMSMSVHYIVSEYWKLLPKVVCRYAFLVKNIRRAALVNFQM